MTGNRDGRDGDGDESFMSEPEFLEEDHGSGIGVDGKGFDLGGGGGEDGEEEQDDDEE